MGASVFSASGFQIADRRLLSEAPAASGGEHTLRSYDLGMILAWHGNGVCDGGHSADVMKRTDGVGQGWPEGRTLEIN
jgi:hypothetical protein